MSGKSPLGYSKEPQSYEGTIAQFPLTGFQVIRAKRDPTSSDKKYPVTSLWINTSSQNVWIQTQPAGVWLQLANSSGDLLISSALTTNGVIYTTGTNTVTSTSAGSSGQLLQSAGASSPPGYTTATYPSTATSTGTILRANGTNWLATTATYPNTTTANDLLYSSATNTISNLATANNGALTTGTTGIPVITALGNGQTIIGQGASSAPAAVSFSNQQQTFVPKFTNIPTMSASTGGVAAVTINTYNIWSVPQWGAAFECYNTTASTAIAPSMSTTAGNGLNIDTITGATSKSIEITEGNTVNSKNAFIIGTSPAFFIKVGFNIATLADVVSLTMGFRKQATYQATLLTGYSDYACIGVQNSVANGEIQIQTQQTGGGETKTDTTQTATAATTFTVQANVSATGVVTYLFNGSAPTVTAAYTFTSALTVVPFIVYTTAGGAHAEVDLVSYQCGFQ